MDKQIYLSRMQLLLDNKDIRDSISSKFVNFMYDQNPKALQEVIDCAEGISTYNNYVSERECKEIIEKSVNYDGSHGFAFQQSVDTILEWLKNNNKQIDNTPYFNKYALIVTMHKFASDQGSVIYNLVNKEDDKFIYACYDLAVAQLKDNDKIKWVRWYFNLDY